MDSICMPDLPNPSAYISCSPSNLQFLWRHFTIPFRGLPLWRRLPLTFDRWPDRQWQQTKELCSQAVGSRKRVIQIVSLSASSVSCSARARAEPMNVKFGAYNPCLRTSSKRWLRDDSFIKWPATPAALRNHKRNIILLLQIGLRAIVPV